MPSIAEVGGERDDIGCIQPPSIAFVARLDALLCILLDKGLNPYICNCQLFARQNSQSKEERGDCAEYTSILLFPHLSVCVKPPNCIRTCYL